MADATVVDRPDEDRFVIDADGLQAELVYEAADGELRLVHTRVPDALGGRGLGGQLVQAAVAKASAEGLTIVPWCPFARRWLEEHPDAVGGVEIDLATPPPD